MQAQQDRGIPFSFAHNQQHFRVIELPQELLDYVSVAGSKLQLKSLEPSEDRSAHAVLCTADKTYQIRQNETSNTVYLTTPDPETLLEDDSPNGITAIATISSTLELTELVSASATSSILNEVLPWPGNYLLSERRYEPWDEDEVTLKRLYASLPFSDAQCDRARRELSVFTFDQKVYRPTAQQIRNVWHDILQLSLADEVKIASHNSSIIEDALDEWPSELVRIILAQLDDDNVAKSALLAIIGMAILESATLENPRVTLLHFMDSWRDALPDSWRDFVDLDLLAGRYQVHDDNIQPKIWRDRPESYDAENEEGNAKKRKWHEKFKASRKK